MDLDKLDKARAKVGAKPKNEPPKQMEGDGMEYTTIRLRKWERNRIMSFAKARGMTNASYILMLIDRYGNKFD